MSDKQIPSREAVRLAIAEGLTSKEAAFKYGHSLRAMLNSANRQGLSFRWSGYGRPPRFISTIKNVNAPKTQVERTLVDIASVSRAAIARTTGSENISQLTETLNRIAKMAEREFFRIR